MKYELIDDTIDVLGHTLRRVRYLADGVLGGWIESERNLSQEGDAKVSDNAKIFGNARVSGDAKVSGNARIHGEAQISDHAHVSGNAEVFGHADVFGNAWVFRDAIVFGDARIFGDAIVSGNARVFGVAQIYGDVLVSGNAQVSGDARVSDKAKIFGGIWEVSPLQIQGSRFFFSVSSEDSITVGCQTRTVVEWRETYEREFENHNFTAAERREYILYFNLAAELYGWDARLPVTENCPFSKCLTFC
jgi:carbonic anhydrase/acetyltransferase-like protein (isoleucine patch superfamily)